MTAADHEMVGAVGFAAWLSGCALDARFKNEGIIEAARHAFVAYPATAKGEVIVAEIDGVIVGWIAREERRDNISDLWVDPVFQGRGVGSRLIQRLIGRMELEGIATQKIDTLASNVPAIGLYQKHGFKIVWQGEEFDAALSINLTKVHLERVCR
jgi:ribosomal-protein-alanine N-acetyltransferase